MDPSQIDYMVIEFPVELRADVIVPQLKAMVDARAMEILDLAFIEKNAHGGVRVLELGTLDATIAGTFVGLEGTVLGLLSDEDLELVAEELPTDSVAAVLVWENSAIRALKNAVVQAGGSVLAHEHVPTRVVERDLAAIGT
ncbi:MAG TPA: DUF6325 family protein [Actinospica sp.]|nr:DUF6325 family protein [Actinospica sp.]